MATRMVSMTITTVGHPCSTCILGLTGQRCDGAGLHAGIIDDIYGADFVDGSTDGNCQDQNGHGTFVAGVVGAVGNNDVGVTGVNQVASIVTCRFMDATGNGWVSDAIRCFDYCMSFDTQVLSNSWGGVAYSDSLQVKLLR